MALAGLRFIIDTVAPRSVALLYEVAILIIRWLWDKSRAQRALVIENPRPMPRPVPVQLELDLYEPGRRR